MVVDFELFRLVQDAALARSDRSRGARPPGDAVLMFEVLVLQALHSLSDDACAFQIRDRLSFMRFLGLGLGGQKHRMKLFVRSIGTTRRGEDRHLQPRLHLQPPRPARRPSCARLTGFSLFGLFEGQKSRLRSVITQDKGRSRPNRRRHRRSN